MSDVDTIHINVTSARTLDEELDVAVEQLQTAAMRTRQHGILVTRDHPGAYTARLSEQVPFGITLERFC